MLNQPTSSPMMKTMFGFLPLACKLVYAALTLGSAMASSCCLLMPSVQQPEQSPVSFPSVVPGADAWLWGKRFSLPDARA